MTAPEGFFLGLGFAAAISTGIWSIAQKVARRVQAARERRRQDALVRAAFLRLAGQMAIADRVLRVKQDMPWTDRLKEAQAGQFVTMGIFVPKPAAV